VSYFSVLFCQPSAMWRAASLVCGPSTPHHQLCGGRHALGGDLDPHLLTLWALLGGPWSSVLTDMSWDRILSGRILTTRFFGRSSIGAAYVALRRVSRLGSSPGNGVQWAIGPQWYHLAVPPTLRQPPRTPAPPLPMRLKGFWTRYSYRWRQPPSSRMKEGPGVTPASRLPLPRTDPVTPEQRVVNTPLARLVFLVIKNVQCRED